jgi:hypothetical protein
MADDQSRDEMSRRLARYLRDEFGANASAIDQWIELSKARASSEAAASRRILASHLDAHHATREAQKAMDALASALAATPGGPIKGPSL